MTIDSNYDSFEEVMSALPPEVSDEDIIAAYPRTDDEVERDFEIDEALAAELHLEALSGMYGDDDDDPVELWYAEQVASRYDDEVPF